MRHIFIVDMITELKVFVLQPILLLSYGECEPLAWPDVVVLVALHKMFNYVCTTSDVVLDTCTHSPHNLDSLLLTY